MPGGSLIDVVLRLFQSAAQSVWIATQLLGLSALLFGAIALLVKGAEAIAAARRALRELRVNLSLYFLDALLVGPALAILVSVIRLGVTRYSLTLIEPSTWSWLGQGATLVAVAFVGDFIAYWRHRLEHTRWLWPAHAIHHSDTEVSWLTLLRFHPINLVGRALAVTPHTGLCAAWAAAVGLVSIPKETVFRLCPVPVDPACGLTVVALPCWGALLLFAVAVIAARSRAPVASPR